MMRSRIQTVILFSIAVFIASMSACELDPEIQSDWFNAEEYYAGGETTIFDVTSAAFSSPANNLTSENLEKHFAGDLTFEQTYVTAPAQNLGGLGPVFNNTSCVGCHTLDGRGADPTVFRVSMPGIADNGGPKPIPLFGTQMQDKAVFGISAEGEVLINYIEVTGFFGDGTAYHLRKPVYTITDTYSPIPSEVLLSVRVAPPVFGLGLLEAIPENDIIAYSDVNDADGDGISGKPNYVWDVVNNIAKIGRFGWKANQPNLSQQTAGAFSEDMGITNPLFPQESCYGQTQYDGLTDDTEIDDYKIEVTTFYSQTLAVPAPRKLDDPEVMRGKQLFFEANCNTCHKPSWQTGVAEINELSNQKIYPYTDMLLHNMGEELSDNRPDFLADGNEWKTRPLWGIGLTMLANGHTNFLHDGRARNIEEAILWHGGEAEESKTVYTNLSKEDRAALLKFVNAL